VWTLVWQVWLTANDDLHGRDSDEKERKRLEKPRPRITALCAKQDSLLASDKQIFALPIHDCMLPRSRKLKTWVRLVTPTVNRALADAEQRLRDTNHTMTDFLAPAQPDPLRTDELLNELHPAPRMQHWIKRTQQTFFSF
jgi:hypothetical protein